MRVSITVHADTSQEFRDALAAVQASFPPGAFDTPRRGFAVRCEPEDEVQGLWPASYRSVGADRLAQARRPLGGGGDAPLPDWADDWRPAESGTRSSDTVASAAAASIASEPAPAVAPAKRSHKAAKPKAVETPAVAEPEPEPDDETSADDDTDPFAAPPDEDPAQMTPGEAKLKALELLREAYVLPGGPPMIKTVQKEFGVGKFVDVPDAKGLDLHARAQALLAQLHSKPAAKAA